MAEVGERHRVARERDRDAGRELHPLGVLGRDDELQERVVTRLRGHDPVVTEILEVARLLRQLGDARPADSTVDFHAGER